MVWFSGSQELSRFPSSNVWQLSYPITKHYPWRWFTLITMILSLTSLAILTLINVAANGYENIDILYPDYNYTQSLWWSPFSISQKQLCDPHQLSTGDTFYTTNGAFQYTVGPVNSMVSYSNKSVGLLTADGWFYSGESLESLCWGPNMGLAGPMMYLVIDRSQGSVNAMVLINCRTMDGEFSFGFQMSYATSILGRPPSFIVDQGPAYFSPPFVLDTLAPDIIVSMVNASMTSLQVAGMVFCPAFQPDIWGGVSPSKQQYDDCMNKNPPVLAITGGTALYADGSMANVTNNLTPALNQSIANYMKALSAASQADLGIWQNNSFFVNQDMMNISISSADAVAAAVTANPSLETYYSQIDGLGHTIPGAQNLRKQSYISDISSNVIKIPIPVLYQRSQSIVVTFVCHTQRLKGTFSFIVSIIIADASEFGALWAFYMIIATYFARRHEISYDAIVRDECPQDEERNGGTSNRARPGSISLSVIHDGYSRDDRSLNKF